MHNHGNGFWGKLVMVLCIAGPVSALAAWYIIPNDFSGRGILAAGLFLMCPLSHLLMMRHWRNDSEKKDKDKRLNESNTGYH